MRGRREENRGGGKVNSQNIYKDSNLRLGVLCTALQSHIGFIV